MRRKIHHGDEAGMKLKIHHGGTESRRGKKRFRQRLACFALVRGSLACRMTTSGMKSPAQGTMMRAARTIPIKRLLSFAPRIPTKAITTTALPQKRMLAMTCRVEGM